ncbi:MAG: TonB-dependent receptor [Rhizorhabdus sp.]|nr:MAG: TonB-dependent receptor [Rhizorhabdus sp.]
MTLTRFSHHASSLSLICAAGLCLSAPVGAQVQDSAPDANAIIDDQPITVTGSRIIRDGSEAPSPLTVVGADLIDKRGAQNVADLLNELPAFRGSTTPSSTANLTKNVGANFANLRSLGVNRTLTLVDGMRFVPSSDLGQVDLNFIPTLMVERAEVVTGGASAVYGTDAVAGVVNLILRRKVQGIQMRGDFGITEQGDGREYRGAILAGTEFADGRGYATIAADIYRSDGADDPYSRDWGRREYGLITNAAGVFPTRLIASNVHHSTMAPGGLITSGSLRGTTFNPDGTPRPFVYGQLAGAQNMIGGEGAGNRLYLGDGLLPKLDRIATYLRTGYELTDSIELVQDLSYARTKGRATTPHYFNFGNLTIRRDNAFLPTSVAARMDAAGETSFGFGRFWSDVGTPVPVSTNATWRSVTGARGSLSDTWKWDVGVEYGENKYHQQILGSFIAPRAAQMIDAVRAPNGTIVCRVALTDPSTACRPFNPFGENRNAADVSNYFRADQDLRQTQTELAASAGLNGRLFDIGAGRWGVAVGAEYRRSTLRAVADPLSNAAAFTFGNARNVRGKITVKEAYIELDAPLLADVAMVKALTVNGAYRYADYSTSGGIDAWKLGATWDVVDALRLRVTRSRDVRAPNIPELFTPSRSTQSITILDPFRNNVPSLVFPFVAGNAALKPERADTLSFGAVIKPFAGFSASADFYDIKISGAISTIPIQDIVNLCFGGRADLCSQISRDAGGFITQIISGGINVASQRTKGIDIEVGYRSALGQGNLDLRLFANHTIKNTVKNGALITRLAGQNDGSPQNGTGGIPSWSVTGIASYEIDRISASVQGRFISAGKINTAFVEGRDIEDNSLPSALYVNLNAHYKLGPASDPAKYKIFATVDNLFDKDPAISPQSVLPINPVFYDILGRRYRVGFGVNF